MSANIGEMEPPRRPVGSWGDQRDQEAMEKAREIAKQSNGMGVVAAFQAEADRVIALARRTLEARRLAKSGAVQPTRQHPAIETGMTQPGTPSDVGGQLDGLHQPGVPESADFAPIDSVYQPTPYPRPVTPDPTADLRFASGLPSSPAEWVDDDEGPSRDWRERVAKKLARDASGALEPESRKREAHRMAEPYLANAKRIADADVTPKPLPEELQSTPGHVGTYHRTDSSRAAPMPDDGDVPDVGDFRALTKSALASAALSLPAEDRAKIAALIASSPEDARFAASASPTGGTTIRVVGE